METKTHWKKQHNYNYLGAYSLIPGEDLVLTIAKLQPEEIIGTNGKKENGFVCHFVEPNVKPMILNKTNCKVIEKIYSTPFIEEWIGKKIQLYVAQVSAFGTTTDALRIRQSVPSGKSLRDELIELYKAKKPKMPISDQRNAERILKDKETDNYDKLKIELNKF